VLTKRIAEYNLVTQMTIQYSAQWNSFSNIHHTNQRRLPVPESGDIVMHLQSEFNTKSRRRTSKRVETNSDLWFSAISTDRQECNVNPLLHAILTISPAKCEYASVFPHCAVLNPPLLSSWLVLMSFPFGDASSLIVVTQPSHVTQPQTSAGILMSVHLSNIMNTLLPPDQD
jgi:hypothetical protein